MGCAATADGSESRSRGDSEVTTKQALLLWSLMGGGGLCELQRRAARSARRARGCVEATGSRGCGDAVLCVQLRIRSRAARVGQWLSVAPLKGPRFLAETIAGHALRRYGDAPEQHTSCRIDRCSCEVQQESFLPLMPLSRLVARHSRMHHALQELWRARVWGCSLCLAGSEPFTISTMPGPQESHTGSGSGAQ